MMQDTYKRDLTWGFHETEGTRRKLICDFPVGHPLRAPIDGTGKRATVWSSCK